MGGAFRTFIAQLVWSHWTMDKAIAALSDATEILMAEQVQELPARIGLEGLVDLNRRDAQQGCA